MRWSRALAVDLSLLAVALVGCTEEVSTVVVAELLYPEDVCGGGHPLDGVETLAIRVVPTDGSVEIVRELSKPATGEWSGMNSGLELGLVSIDWARVVIEGLSADREVLSAGETIPVPIMSGKSGRLSVFFQRLGSSGVAPALSQPWSQHSATYLEGGGVMFVGGAEDLSAVEAWVYALDLYESIEVASLGASRALSEITAFDGTKALLVGGSRAETSALVYTPATNSWSELPLPEPVQGSWPRPLVTALPGGSALAIRDGALVRFDPGAEPELLGELSSDLVLSGETLTVVSSGLAILVGAAGVVGIDYFHGVEVVVEQPTLGGRSGHCAAALSDGRLVVMGGEADGALLEGVEVYDNAADVGWTVIEGLLAGQARHGARLTPLRDDRLLLSGGEIDGAISQEAVVIDLVAETATPICLVTPRRWHTATALPTGAVLLAGGEGDGGEPLDSVEIVRPAAP